MASSKPSGSKRKLDWAGIEDSFALSKKPRATKPSELPFGSMLDFPRPTFEQRSPAVTSKGKGPAFSVPPQMSELSFHNPPSRTSLQTPRKEPKHEARLSTPKPPRPPSPLRRDARPPSSTKNWISLAEIPPPPILEPAFEPTPATPKNMKSAFRTPLIPGAFASPPASQELKIPLSEILGDMSPKRMSSWEMELNRGLQPSPVKGGQSPKRSFIRGGLADRAKLFMTRSTTDYSLWYQDVSSSARGSEPSLRVCVKDIICQYPSHEPPILPQSNTQYAVNLSSVLTRCRRLDSTSGDDENEVLILFKTSPSRGSQSAEGVRKRVADPLLIAIGREVLLWHPWTEVQIPPAWTEVQIPPSAEHESADSPKMALLCSRFVVK